MKKKILLLTTFIFAIVTILYSVGIKGVNAETCTTYTNYYPLLSAVNRTDFTAQFDSGKDPWSYTTTTERYSLNLPENAVIVNKGVVEIILSGEDSFDEMTLESFYEKFGNDENVYTEDGGITNYIKGNSYIDENGNVQNQGIAMPDTYAEFEKQIPEGFGNPEINLLVEDGTVQLTVKRTWSSNELENIESGVVYSPAAYYIQYQICEEPKKVNVTINFGTNNDCSEGTDIRNLETTEYEEGESVRYTIPEIDGYDFSNVGVFSPTTFKPTLSANSSNLSFTVPAKNATICLVYIKNPQTGAGLIYLAWIVGIAALVYSGWYFMNYYKNRNNEV